MRLLQICSALLLALPALSACSNGESEKPSEDRQVTETRMDDIDQIEGTISDEMIDTSESTEQAPLAGKEKDDPAESSTGNASEDNE